MILLASQGYHCAREAVLDSATERLAELTDASRQRLELWLSERLADAAFLASCPTVRQESRAEHENSPTAATTSEFLRLFATKYGTYEAIGLYDPRWRELAAAGTEEHGLDDFERSDIKQAVQAATGPAVGRIHRHEDGELGIHFGAVVLDAERASAGYVLTALDQKALTAVLRGGTPTPAYRCYLVSTDGLMLTEANPARSGAALSERVDTEGFRRAADGETGAAVYRDASDREVVGGFASIPGMDWILLMEQDAEVALAWLPELGWRAAFTALIVAIIVIFLALRSVRTMTTPLQQLAEVANLVARGDHNARAEPASQSEVNAVGTALNDMLDKLAGARQRVVQSETLAAMGEMSSAVVHEMRNPLSSIKLNLQAIRTKLDGDPRHEELADIAQAQVHRLERMFSDLLSLSRPLAMNFRVAPLRETVIDALEAVAEQAADKRCRFQLQEIDTAIRARIDPERFQQALVNLFQNAMQATGDGGEVVVVTHLDHARRLVRLEVTDNGPGVSDDNLERLFQPFFTTREDGTGLGLAIVRKIVEYHGGRVSASNRADSTRQETGAVFRIDLPYEPQQP